MRWISKVVSFLLVIVMFAPIGVKAESATGEVLAGHLESTTPEKWSYKGDGTAANPYTVRARFANRPADDANRLQATWKAYNYFAGYPTDEMQTVEEYQTRYDASHIMSVLVEDRDESGKLIGSFRVDGSKWGMTISKDKGPYYMNYLLDPTDEYLTAGYALDNHYSYGFNAEGGDQRKAEAVRKLKQVRDSKASALLLQYRMRNYSGPITYTMDASGLGKFKPGDTVSIHYLLGASDRNSYHGVKPSLGELLVDESTYSKFYQDKNLTAVVDQEGYLSFDLYNGGYFELRNESAVKEQLPEQPSEEAKGVLFSDVPESHWAYDSVSYLANNKIINGYSDGTFQPDEQITRAEFMKGLLLSCAIEIQKGESGFADVPKNYWGKDYIYTATQIGLTKGISETAFGTNYPITREEMAVLICRAMALLPIEKDDFIDESAISAWAKGYIGACVQKGFIKGYEDYRFMPQNQLTRAEAAVVFMRIIHYKKNL